MFKKNKILAIIPARGGSKGLPKKNIKLFNGKPLIYWTLKSAQGSKLLDDIFVSTDCTEIANVVEDFGVNIPKMRPKELAQDNSPSSDLIIHALDYFKEVGKQFDYVALLEPTSPLRKNNDIDEAISTLINHKEADALVSIGEVHTEHPDIVKKENSFGYLEPFFENNVHIYQRQQADTAFFPYGVIYISKVKEFYKNKSFYTDKLIGYNIERWQNFEIDDLLDFEINEFLFKKNNI